MRNRKHTKPKKPYTLFTGPHRLMALFFPLLILSVALRITSEERCEEVLHGSADGQFLTNEEIGLLICESVCPHVDEKTVMLEQYCSTICTEK